MNSINSTTGRFTDQLTPAFIHILMVSQLHVKISRLVLYFTTYKETAFVG
jgi:hypothetical protein